MTDALRQVLIVIAGALGALGVATAAMASHGEEVRNLAAISAMALAHAPALLAIALAGKGRVLIGAGVILALGSLFFIADLLIRQWTGHGLFPGAAPIGGGALIIGWLGIAVSAAFWSVVKD